MYKTTDLLDLNHTIAKEYLENIIESVYCEPK